MVVQLMTMSRHFGPFNIVNVSPNLFEFVQTCLNLFKLSKLDFITGEPSEAETTQKLTEHYEAFNGTDISVHAVLKWDKYFPR